MKKIPMTWLFLLLLGRGFLTLLDRTCSAPPVAPLELQPVGRVAALRGLPAALHQRHAAHLVEATLKNDELLHRRRPCSLKEFNCYVYLYIKFVKKLSLTKHSSNHCLDEGIVC